MSAVASSRAGGGAVCHLTFDGGKGNVLTSALSSQLRAALRELAADDALKCVILSGAGASFSFGASVEEHLPEHARAMLDGFHELVRSILRFPVPVLGAVRGQCLGGGLELALACTRIFASPDTRLGQPEIKLAVFAPAASALLPHRVGQSTADELLCTGRVVGAVDAAAMRLVDEVAEDPTARAEQWALHHLGSLAPGALRLARRAARAPYVEAVCARIDALEALYVGEVLTSAEAHEGLNAFLEKRSPRFAHA